MLNMLVDGALTDGADLMIAVSTPVLQAAIQRGRHVPTVFDYVANPIIAGAGESDRRHLPWVTGVYIMSDFSGMISAIKECNIGVRRIGTLFCPAEINSVYFRDELVKAAQNDGFDVVSVPANTSGDMPDAAMALCGRNIDAICQISDNLSSAGFSSVVKAANQAHLPLFVFQSKQAESGAVLAIARDFIDAGRSTGAMAARIVRGTSPAQIPFQHSNATKIIINMDAARRLNMKIPQSLLSRASQVFSQ